MRKIALAAVLPAAAAVLAFSGTSGGAAAQKKPLRWAQHDLFIETNATDRDAGLQLKLDAEDWTSLRIRDPRGRRLLDIDARGAVRRYGLSELFFEASEPSFDESPFRRFKRRFPEGRYTFRGRSVDGRLLAGSDTFSHVVPAGPKVTFPTKGAEVAPSGFAVAWEPVTRPAGVDIRSYIVVVVQGEREMTMDLPGDRTSVSVPGQFLEPGRKSSVEVLAREKSGNQTITAVSFRTR